MEFRIADFCYPLSILRLRAQFERTQWYSPEEIVEHQEVLLRRTVRHCYDNVPYYRELFQRLRLTPGDVRRVADLQKLPTLSKADVCACFGQLQALNKYRYHPREVRTSGTSGEPLAFLTDKANNVLEFCYYWRHWSWAGYRLGARFAELTSQYFLKNDDLADRCCQYQRRFGRLLLNSLAFSVEKMDIYADALRCYRPRFLKGIASALFFFAHSLNERGISDIQFEAVFSTGEMLLPAQRALIEKTFGCKAHDSYGHMERTVAASECPFGGMHVNDDYGVMELVEGGGATSSADEDIYTARVLGTSLHNRAMPLLRYEVGDRVQVERSPSACPCGRKMRLIRRVIGRNEDVITTPDGSVVTTLFIVFEQLRGISLAQAVQVEPRRLVLRVVPSADYTTDTDKELLRYVRRFVGHEMQLSVEQHSAGEFRRLNRGKFRAVVSEISARQRANERTQLVTAAR